MNPAFSKTFFGRHRQAMLRIPELLKGRKKVTAWVIGLGGASRHFPERPTEHIEAAEMLRRAGVEDFKVYAIDLRKEAVEAAEEDLAKGRLESPIKDGKMTVGKVEGNVVFRRESEYPKDWNFMFYHDLFFDGGEYDLTPLRKKIVPLHITPNTGNAILETPQERPDLILCFNVAAYAHNTEPLAKTLMEALNPEGFVITLNDQHESWFRQKLKDGLERHSTIQLGPHFISGYHGYNIYTKKQPFKTP